MIPEEAEEMLSSTWDSAESHCLTGGEVVGDIEVKKEYFTEPIFGDYVTVSVLEKPIVLKKNGKTIAGRFLVHYSPTGSDYLFSTWTQAVAFRKSRAAHILAAIKIFGP